MKRSSSSRGFALVVVLAFLVLITVLAVAFFAGVSTEYQSSKIYSDQVGTRQLADSAVQIAMAQIRKATTLGSGVAWASQPGMIRTYGTSGNAASASPRSYFKLYSSDKMQLDGTEASTFDPANDMESDWNAKPALFSDLNAPVKDSQGRLVFPIIDPRAYSGGSGDIEGFSYSASAGTVGGGSKTIAGVATIPGDDQRLPMPVKWIYVLQDGALTTPTGSGDGGKIATWDGAPADLTPSKDNPIVGRLAFWTDDETCKININTAGEGVYWDAPRFGGSSTGKGKEVDYAKYQPALYEFQRYPGHPAGVALSPVLSPLAGVTDPAMLAEIAADIAPRLAPGGSKGGTVAFNEISPVNLADAKRQALYTSVDELMFSDDSSGNEREKASAGAGALTNEQLQKARFFLTASSRAPEVNLFGQPRISMWPIHADLASDENSPYTTGIDRLLAFVSTLRKDLGAGEHRYFFQRKDALSPVADYDDIARNRELYAWLQRNTTREIPGFGGSFLGKYPQDRDQILTEVLDYIRTTNLFDANLGPNSIYPFVQIFRISQTRYSGVVAPIKIGQTKGFGRQYTLTEAALCFICVADANNADSNNPATNPALEGVALNPGEKRYQIALLFEAFTTMYGPAVSGNMDLILAVDGLAGMTIGNTVGEVRKNPFSGVVPDGFNPSSYTRNNPGNLLRLNRTERPWGWQMAPEYFMTQSNGGGMNMPPSAYAYPSQMNNPGTVIYPYVSKPFTVSDGSIAFGGGKLTIKLYQGKFCDAGSGYEISGRPLLSEVVADSDNLIQTLELSFPPAPSLPCPSLHGDSGYWGFAPRLRNGRSHQSVDVVQSLFPGHGDTRLLAAKGSVPESDFVTKSTYGSDSMAHRLRSNFVRMTGNTGNQGVLGVDANVDIPPSDEWPEKYAKWQPSLTGDWDGAFGVAADGPYINMPDVGDQQTASLPYYVGSSADVVNSAMSFYTPNRVMPSPGMLGSLPTGVFADQPWQTLLFRPQKDHPQSAQSRPGQPPDHLLMDLFWMPVVEPYAVSDPFSTAGKVNMNYQIAPFTHINRHTALNAVLKGERMISVPGDTGGANYKSANNTAVFRFQLNPDEKTGSLRQFREKFSSGDLFRSATEICDIYLVPGQQEQPKSGSASPVVASQSWSSDSAAENYWKAHQRTSDNSRERVYTTLYPRLTTKSNAFTVHYRVQTLQKTPSTPANQWVEGRDKVTGEIRGSSLIERYLDPADSKLADYAGAAQAGDSLEELYKFRILNSKRFSP